MLVGHVKGANNEIFVAKGYATHGENYGYVISKQNANTFNNIAPHRPQRYVPFKVPVSVMTKFIHPEA